MKSLCLIEALVNFKLSVLRMYTLDTIHCLVNPLLIFVFICILHLF